MSFTYSNQVLINASKLPYGIHKYNNNIYVARGIAVWVIFFSRVHLAINVYFLPYGRLENNTLYDVAMTIIYIYTIN